MATSIQSAWWVRHLVEKHTYHWEVELNGVRQDAFLTYALKRPSDRYRRILAVEVSQPERVRAWLDDDCYNALRMLHELFRQKRRTGLGKTGAAKAMALEIYRGQLDMPYLDVAVHKFGAVPIYLVPGTSVSLELFGGQRECSIGIFVSGGEIDSRELDSESDSSRPVNALELVRSLSIHPDLQFIRYLEDVGEYTHDLHTRHNWSYVFRYGRKMEELLKASVFSKIDTVLRNAAPRTVRKPNEVRLALREEAERYLTGYSGLLCKYSTARVLYLFLLNHLYRAVGMKDKCDYYGSQCQNGWKQFFPSVEDREVFCDGDTELGHLYAIWQAWHSTDAEAELAALQRDTQNAAHWVRRLTEFACFASRIKQVNLEPEATKVFFSSRQVESMRQLRQQVAASFERQFAGWAALLYVESTIPGFAFADQIPLQVWLSDALIAVYSQREELKKRDWVSYEVGLAKEFKLPCMIVTESTVTHDDVFRRFSNENTGAATQWLFDELIPPLPESLKERVNFLERPLIDKVHEAGRKKCETLLKGFLRNFFTPEHRRIISQIHLACLEPWSVGLPSPGSVGGVLISDLAHILSMNEKKLRTALREITGNERALSFPSLGAEIPPVVVNQSTRCHGNLLAAMEVLRPDLVGREGGKYELKEQLVQIMKTLL